MNRTGRILFTAMLVGMADGATAREPTKGAALWAGCTADFFSPAYYESYAACRAYVIGIADVLSAGDSVAGKKACIPDNASKADVTEKVVGWLESAPAGHRQGPAHALVAEAISRAYPCK